MNVCKLVCLLIEASQNYPDLEVYFGSDDDKKTINTLHVRVSVDIENQKEDNYLYLSQEARTIVPLMAVSNPDGDDVTNWINIKEK